MERSPHYIKIWFWARNDPSVPSEVVNGAAVVDPNTWVSNQIAIIRGLENLPNRGNRNGTLP